MKVQLCKEFCERRALHNCKINRQQEGWNRRHVMVIERNSSRFSSRHLVNWCMCARVLVCVRLPINPRKHGVSSEDTR